MRIDFSSFLFRLTATEKLLLPAYKGSTFRGGFGNAFRRVVCALRKNDCADCLLKKSCVYAYVFETSPAEGAASLRNYSSIPHPFIIEPPPETREEYAVGEIISFGLVLVGRAIDYLPYFIYSFTELGHVGLGRGRGKFNLLDVHLIEDNEVVYSSASAAINGFKRESIDLPDLVAHGADTVKEEVTLDFLTPTRIMYNSRLTSELEFHMLIRQLLRRLSNLSYFHCSNSQWDLDFRSAIDMAGEVSIKNNELSWHDWERYSSRQETRMKMGGVIGSVTYKGNVGPFLPFLKAGEILHVGKATSFGLGRYEIK